MEGRDGARRREWECAHGDRAVSQRLVSVMHRILSTDHCFDEFECFLCICFHVMPPVESVFGPSCTACCLVAPRDVFTKPEFTWNGSSCSLPGAQD